MQKASIINKAGFSIPFHLLNTVWFPHTLTLLPFLSLSLCVWGLCSLPCLLRWTAPGLYLEAVWWTGWVVLSCLLLFWSATALNSLLMTRLMSHWQAGSKSNLSIKTNPSVTAPSMVIQGAAGAITDSVKLIADEATNNWYPLALVSAN